MGVSGAGGGGWGRGVYACFHLAFASQKKLRWVETGNMFVEILHALKALMAKGYLEFCSWGLAQGRTWQQILLAVVSRNAKP